MNGLRWTSLVALVASLLILTGCVINFPFSGRERTPRMVEETLIEPDRFWTTNKVLLASVDGLLTDSPDTGRFFSQPSALVRFKDILKKAETDPSIRALLIRVNSPGGFVTASDLLYNELRLFKEKTHKKVVVFFMDTAASGAYYMAMAGDRLIACPTTITGSIGVIAVFPGLQGLTGKIGVNMRVIKSGEFKDMGSMWHDFSPPEQEILQNTVNTLYERFLKVVAEGRPKLDPQTIRRLADGRVYTAPQAKELGLIDDIGYMEDAFKQAKNLAGIKDASLVGYRHRFGYIGHYYASMDDTAQQDAQGGPQANSGLQLNLLNINMPGLINSGGGAFYYLWLP